MNASKQHSRYKHNKSVYAINEQITRDSDSFKIF